MKNIRIKIWVLIVPVVFAALLLGACSSHRKSATTQPTETAAPSKKIRAKNTPEVLLLTDTYSQWETFYAPFSFQAIQPARLSVSGRATMVRDKYIFLSLRMLGIEIAFAYIDSDSVYVADKIHKIMAAAPLDAITSTTNMTLGNVQDLMLGRAFYPGKESLCTVDLPEVLFSAAPQNGFTILTPRRIPGGVDWYYTLDETPALSRLTIEPEGKSIFVVDFDGVRNTEVGMVASEVEVSGKLGSRNVEAMYEWTLAKAKWNQPVSNPSVNFTGYRQMSVSDLLSAIKKL